ncbi:hypothetical protein HK100_006926 [Physocladia obscura]|uniref:NADP-dependent oxidoreductase domain-containing protein n=1 Tax=Physocladia obscura TaxID=109957 RepID=A0AAD5SPU1_9FUNG|nr:hypothetical protein HK100_006926 [Physocladia obscura]
MDTADAYSNGQSELILGEALRRYNIPRDQVVIATKVYFPVSEDIGVNTLSRGEDDPSLINRSGLSRKHIFEAVEASLKRLGISYIDLYQIHRFDYNTEIEETMEALNDLVRMGKVRYLGASSMQFAKMNHVAAMKGWAKFVTMQNFYNLLYREEEREMIKYCNDEGIAILPWSPLARGLLATNSANAAPTLRSTTDAALKRWFPKESEEDAMILDRLRQLAGKRGVGSAVVALAWLLGGNSGRDSKSTISMGKGVSSAIVGITKAHYLDELVQASRFILTKEEIQYLEEPYLPKPIMGHS